MGKCPVCGGFTDCFEGGLREVQGYEKPLYVCLDCFHEEVNPLVPVSAKKFPLVDRNGAFEEAS